MICPCPWVISVDFLRSHNIHYVAHDDLPYNSAGSNDIYYDVKRLGMFRATQRTDGISTSDIILRIIKDYDMYVERSLQRGYKREDIGISATKAFRIKLKQKINNFKEQLIQKEQEKETLNNPLKMKKQKSSYKSVINMFQNLEYQTEQVWHDFTEQYKSKAIKDREAKMRQM